ncbi:MAG: response regulator [Bacteroidetes bacterium]|nr:response regulator [Bacteroidota bacterium]
MSSPIRVIIADDHRMFADGLLSIFHEDDDIQIIDVASDGNAVLEKLAKASCDVVLMDLSMPGMNGEEASRIILKNFPETRIIVLTMHHTVDIILPLVDLGVHGFMLKNSGRNELKKGLQEVMEGRKYYSQDIRKVLERKEEPGNQMRFTSREKEILILIYEGLSTAEMAEKLFLSPYTVETHRRNLLSKTETKNATQLINKAIEQGWIQVRPRL